MSSTCYVSNTELRYEKFKISDELTYCGGAKEGFIKT